MTKPRTVLLFIWLLLSVISEEFFRLWSLLGREIRQRAGVPVVDGVAAAVSIAESPVQLGLSTSKVRTYGTPRPKKVIGWPFEHKDLEADSYATANA